MTEAIGDHQLESSAAGLKIWSVLTSVALSFAPILLVMEMNRTLAHIITFIL